MQMMEASWVSIAIVSCGIRSLNRFVSILPSQDAAMMLDSLIVQMITPEEQAGPDLDSDGSHAQHLEGLLRASGIQPQMVRGTPFKPSSNCVPPAA